MDTFVSYAPKDRSLNQTFPTEARIVSCARKIVPTHTSQNPRVRGRRVRPSRRQSQGVNALQFSSQEAAMIIRFPVLVTIIVVLYILSAIKILREYERGVIFRLGRLLLYAKGPGMILVFAPVDRMVRISLRQEALEVKPQDVITRDNVTLKVNAVIFLRVIDPRQAVVEVSDYLNQTSQFAQTTLRSVLGEAELDELLAHREKINMRLQSILDTHTAPWGVKVVNVEVKQVDLPESMLRAMAKQAE